ncbi:transglycosylase family protein [Tessaracoccus antarcticus]|nr:resuscitation-promoting factor [Tessaracoccus antarcticus]
MGKKLWIPAAAGGAALALVATTGIATAMHKNDIEIVVDGAASSIAVRENTVGEVLELQGISLDEHDVVLPAVDTRITAGMEITVAYGRPLEISVDGKPRQVWTTAQSVGEALAFLNLDEADSKLSASRSTSIGRIGLAMEIATAKDVTLTVAGTPSALTVAGTVADALTSVGATPDADDIVTPAPDTVLTDGLAISFVAVEVKESVKEVAMPYKKTETTSDELAKGTTKVTTKGAEGLTRETYTDVYHDGALISSTLAESVISRQPVHQVTTVGTFVAPTPTPAPSPVEEAVPADTSSTTSSSGKALNLARASMWDRIARCESTNNWSINTGNGYYGGLQFNLQTWRSVGGTDFAAYPHQASRAEQITVANRLYAERGTQPWSCA